MFNTCIIICTLATGLFGAMLYVVFNPYHSSNVVQFINTLDTQQQNIFLQIHEERMKIFIFALVIALICGTIYLLSVPEYGVMRSCMFTLIVLSLTYIIYLIYPKSKYMEQYLVRPNQKRALNSLYKNIKYRVVMGMILGAGAYLLITML